MHSFEINPGLRKEAGERKFQSPKLPEGPGHDKKLQVKNKMYSEFQFHYSFNPLPMHVCEDSEDMLVKAPMHCEDSSLSNSFPSASLCIVLLRSCASSRVGIAQK